MQKHLVFVAIGNRMESRQLVQILSLVSRGQGWIKDRVCLQTKRMFLIPSSLVLVDNKGQNQKLVFQTCKQNRLTLHHKQIPDGLEKTEAFIMSRSSLVPKKLQRLKEDLEQICLTKVVQ